MWGHRSRRAPRSASGKGEARLRRHFISAPQHGALTVRHRLRIPGLGETSALTDSTDGARCVARSQDFNFRTRVL